jgi:amino acid permease
MARVPPRANDHTLYGALRGDWRPGRKTTAGHRAMSASQPGRKTTAGHRAMSASQEPTRSLLGDGRSSSEPEQLLRRAKRKKSRAYSSRSRMLLLPSFEEAWRIEQAALSDACDESHGVELEIEQASSWHHAAAIIVGEIIGSGILGLPGAFASLGLFIGTACCVMFCLFSMYSGVLLARVRNVFFPDTESYADAAQHSWGPRFKSFTKCLVLLNWLALLPYYLLTIAKSLQIALEDHGTDPLCFYQYSLFAAAGLFVFLQFRTLSGIAYAALLSDVAIIAAIVLILVFMDNPASASDDATFLIFVNNGTTPAPVAPSRATHFSSLLWPLPGTFLQIYGRTSTMVFAYQGQSIYYEIMREMESSSDFPKAIFAASTIMGSVYLATCLISVWLMGRNVPEFLPDAIPASHLLVRRIVGWLLAYHVVVSYILTNQPLASTFHAMLSPDTLLDYVSWRGKLFWLAITSALLGFSFLLANAIPFFSTFQALIGSLLGAPLMFGWPAFFYLSACVQQGSFVPYIDGGLCFLFLIVFLPLCTVAGCISAVQNLISNWASQGLPFQCP